ncbi:MAG: type II secretion system F family protein [Candidatus Omnitrophica bacterium]|nr:type II secretion system F family protein [Candidatus Omnitrophota bacterium]MDD5351545.1 type II secretion system F family protein [Candidatus Omnitrophota bacterium]MDD5550980.1 type II secretion system F family protein [Candidatus Omnitrophota bacterium]
MEIIAQIILFIAIIVLLANVLIVMLTSYELKTAIQRRLKVDAYSTKNKKSFFGTMLDFFVPVNYMLVNKFFKRNKMEEKMFAARLFMMPEHFLAIKELLAFFFLFLTFLFIRSGDVAPLIILPIVGFIAPDIWLNFKVQDRRSKIIRTLPDTVDLLSLCVDAGLDFIAAARWIVDKSFANAFTEELSLVLHEIKVGKSRRDALADMAKRLSLPDVTAFCRTLIQADRMGIPIAQALSVLSDDVRERFFRRAERIALQAPMKMLIPLIFFILPVVAVIVGGPVLLQFVTTGGLGGLR